MPQVFNDEAVRVALHQLCLGHENINVMYFRTLSQVAWSLAKMNTLLDTIETWLGTSVDVALSEDAGYRRLVATVLSPTQQIFVDRQLDPTIPGTVAQPSVGNNQALCVSFRTDVKGRSFRGRNYLGGVPITALTNPNNVTTAFAASIVQAYDLLVPELIVADAQHCVYSQFTNGQARQEGLLTPITYYLVDTRLDTQRRRMKGA